MPYITACFSEAARLAPGFICAERICTKDWQHNGIYIPKGQKVVFLIWSVNRHQDYHQDPDEFIPDRFLGDSKTSMDSYAFATFAKNCPGTRWAYKVNKILLLSLFQEFRVELKNDTKIKWKSGNGYIPQFCPVFIDLVPRNNN